MRILLIDSDVVAGQSVELMMKSEGFNVYLADDGAEGIDLAKLYDYDAITLTLTLPDMSGNDVIRALRKAKIATPILVLSGYPEPEYEVKAFDLGADDYMVTPVHKDVLIARVKAIVRRSTGHASPAIIVGDLAINLTDKTASVAGRSVHLTGQEYRMLELLALRKGATITKEMFLNHLYGGRDEPEIKIIDVFICKLRKKLADASGGRNYVETLWGRGYALKDPEVCAPVQHVKPPGITRAMIAAGRAEANAQ